MLQTNGFAQMQDLRRGDNVTEHDIQTNIMINLSAAGCIVHRTNTGVFYTRDGRPVTIGNPGQSDLQGHRPDGKCFYIEVKKPGQKPRQDQLRFIDAMRKSGAIAFWSDNADEVVQLVMGEQQNVIQESLK